MSFKLSFVLSHSAMSDSLQPCGQTAASQATLSIGFSQQETHWSELPFPLPGNLPDPRIKPVSPALQMDSLWKQEMPSTRAVSAQRILLVNENQHGEL